MCVLSLIICTVIYAIFTHLCDRDCPDENGKFPTSMMTSSNGNIFCVTGPLWRESLTSGFPSNGQWRVALMFSLICVVHPWYWTSITLQWRHNERDGVSNHRRLDCLLNRMFRRRSKKTSKLCVTGLCEGNSPVTGEFPAQRASNAGNISIWWRHHASS